MGLGEDFEPIRASLLLPVFYSSWCCSQEAHLWGEPLAYLLHVIILSCVGYTFSSSKASHYCIHYSFTNELWTSHLLVFQRYLLRVLPKAMISLFVTNYKNSCKSKTKLLFLGQLLCVPQIYWFLQVFGFLTYYSWYWGNSSIGFIPDFHCPFDTSGKHSWFFYITCCNHMNPDES